MTSITFIYKVEGQNESIQYGKVYLNNFNQYTQGIDEMIYDITLFCINDYRSQNNLENIDDIYIGIISVFKEWSSIEEKNIFSLYINCSDYDERYHCYYYNGMKYPIKYKIESL